MIPRWLSLLILAVMGYLFYLGNMRHETVKVVTPEPVAVEETATDTAPLPTLPAADIEHWKRTINPAYAAISHCELPVQTDGATLPFKVIEESDGTGEAAKCTNVIRVKLTVWNSHGTAAYSESLRVALGAHDIASGLDAGLIGMRTGGTRMLILPPAALERRTKSPAPKALLSALHTENTAIVTVTRLADADAPAAKN